MALDAIALGAVNIDVLARVGRFPERDEEVLIERLMQAPGGSAANFAVGLARLGFKVGFVGKVGHDDFGDMLIKEFHREGVDIAGLSKEEGCGSGTVFIMVDKKGDRAMCAYRGANSKLQSGDIDPSYIAQAKVLHITGTQIKAAKTAVTYAVTSGVMVSFDPGSVLAALGVEPVRQILRYVDVLMSSQVEAEMLTGKSDPKAAGRELLRLGLEKAVIKLGEKGCLVTTREKTVFSPGYRVEVVDTTGAGDAFAAGFIAGTLLNKDLEETAELANAAAAIAVTKLGARTALPKLNDIMRFLKETR